MSTHRQKATLHRTNKSLLSGNGEAIMLENILESKRTAKASAPIRRSFATLYHADTINHCPACSHSHWIIGRTMAECAFCATALPLAASSLQPARPLFRNNHLPRRAA
jgi:hypothetical protein